MLQQQKLKFGPLQLGHIMFTALKGAESLHGDIWAKVGSTYVGSAKELCVASLVHGCLIGQ